MKKLPDDHSLLIILARLDLQEGRPGEAEQWLRHALDTDPTDPEARYALASSLQEQDRLEEAAAELDRCDKDKATLRRLNQLLENEAAHPSTDPAALFEIGSVFLRSGQERLGEYWMNQALERDPDHQPTLRALVEYYENKGAQDKAAAYRARLTSPEQKASPP